jgi:hypothetical protein
MNLCLTFSHFEELYKNGYSVDMLFLLKLAQEGNDIKSLCDGSPKLGALFQGVVRKGLLTEDSKLTLSGRDVLDVLNKETIEKPLTRKAPDKTDDFERWWKAYPGTDTFAYKGKTFEGTRSLRTKKDDCKLKLTKILNEGEYTIDEMVAALEYEVVQKKENSVKASENKLKYMQNSLTYLNQRTFEPFIELIKEGVKIIPSQSAPKGSVDI